MQLHQLELAETQAFSEFFVDYINQKDTLREFYHRFPSEQNLKEQLKEKSGSFKVTARETLNKSLTNQYKSLKPKAAVIANIGLLAKENTFTITTGHQLNILTGPLFFIYKIVTVINACKKLKELYPEYNFVPVYWMATEDHDYEEISTIRLYGNKHKWITDQKGAVGKFKTTGLDQLLNELPGDTSVFREAYKQSTLTDAVRFYINELFGDYGLIAIDGDDGALKSKFAQVIGDDVLRNTPHTLVEEKNKKLESLGYHTQVFVRDINFFYLDENLRGRIAKTEQGYEVVDSDLSFSDKEITQLIEKHPERFSPNVILRPLYQEMILPNLAYVGGPAEMIYWLQLKGTFDQYKVPFPVLLPRNFAMIIEKHVLDKWAKTGLSIDDLFKEKNFLFNEWILKNTKHQLTLGNELNVVSRLVGDIRGRAQGIDPTLAPLVAAEGKRMTHSLEKIERKLLKAEKRLHADKLGQIASVKDALFPGGGLQERTDNFLNFYQKDENFIREMLKQLDPFSLKFNVLWYD
jgi:bacillithiol biosynthesis cysteine-adding enzyme BshC